jgi:hypothetical protein
MSSPGDQLQKIVSYLWSKQRSISDVDLPRNLFVYYVGHGLSHPTENIAWPPAAQTIEMLAYLPSVVATLQKLSAKMPRSSDALSS